MFGLASRERASRKAGLPARDPPPERRGSGADDPRAAASDEAEFGSKVRHVMTTSEWRRSLEDVYLGLIDEEKGTTP